MALGSMTVSELQAILDDIPGDAVVTVRMRKVDGEVEYMKKRDGSEDSGRAIWGDIYNTREIYNAYGCIDDRYEQNRTVVIELGDFSP